MTTVAPVNPRGSCPATPVDSLDFDGPVPAGAFRYSLDYRDAADAEPKGLLFGCPCGCGQMMSVRFRPYKDRGPAWDWDGNRDRPTLTPSIDILQLDSAGQRIGSHWHGWLTAGEFRSC